MVPKDNGHLLTHAESILNPEVFSHPVWLRFGGRGLPSKKFIDELLGAAKAIQGEDPGSACQILFICVACQNHAGQRDKALRTLKQIQTLAEQNRLFETIIWAKWGVCSVLFQGGAHEQAIIQMEILQKILNQRNEWMLVDFIDVVKESLCQPQGIVKGPVQPNCEEPPEDLLAHTYYWLQHWGNSYQLSDIAYETNSYPPTKNSESVRHQVGYWRNFFRTVRDSIKWRIRDTNHHSTIPPHPTTDTPYAPKVFRPVLELKVENALNLETKLTTNHVVAQMLGRFSLAICDSPLKIPVSRGLSLLKYIILHHNQNFPREILMEVFWPETDPESARNNLNVAMHSLRRALRSATDLEVVRFEGGTYSLVPDLEIWLDVDEFEHCIREGQRLEARDQLNSAITEYEIAINLYRGDFLADNPYENWTVLDRERLRVTYLDTLDSLSQIYFNQDRYAACANLCQLILSRDACREDAHCRLMRSYSHIGQAPLALRQYQICVEALQSELAVEPAPETRHLFEQIRSHQRI